MAEPPVGSGWVHEVEYEGNRIGADLAGGRAILWSGRGKDWTARSWAGHATAARPLSPALLAAVGAAPETAGEQRP